MSATIEGRAGDRDRGRVAEQRGWYWYDWANSAFITTVVAVFGGRYLTSLADAAADASGFVHPLGIPVRAGSFYPYLISVTAVFQVVSMLVVGAVADHTGRRRRLLGSTAFAGAAATVAFGLTGGSAYALGGLFFLVASVAFACSIVVYNSFLPDIAGPEERDRVSARGWGFGYLGGGLLLLANLVLYQFAEAGRLPFATSAAAQVSIVSAGLWWAVFSLIPLAALRDRTPSRAPAPGRDEAGGPTRAAPPVGHMLRASLRQLGATLGMLRLAPMTLLFLVAYLFYNNSIQTVVNQASLFAEAELGLVDSTIIVAVLLVQFVAMAGAWLLGLLAARLGAKRAVLASLVVWGGTLGYAFVLPAGEPGRFFVLAGLVGLVLGGSQALSRSLFSHMAPQGREAEYFGVYEMAGRSTSWLGSALFGLAYQFTESYRISILSLAAFTVVGFVLLARADVRRAVAEAGNEAPARL